MSSKVKANHNDEEAITVSEQPTEPDFEKSPLIPVIAQDAASGDVLMLAYMNREAWNETLSTGKVCYYSRSRDKLWRKGEESGNVQHVKAIFFDCDRDTLLIKVEQIGGAACHEGYKSCFFRQIDPATKAVTVIGDPVFDPKAVYKKS
jgi:phosphoribosyl-AMP cyclohydrolase